MPIAESIGALAELKDEGKIRHVGVSNFSEDQLREAERVTAVVSVQNRYNVVDRSSEPMLDLCDQEMLVFLPWAPIEDTGAIPAVLAAARRHRVSERQVALAWLLTRSPQVLPIPGSATRTTSSRMSRPPASTSPPRRSEPSPGPCGRLPGEVSRSYGRYGGRGGQPAMTTAALTEELRLVEEDLARLRKTAVDLRRRIGNRDEEPTDAAERSALIQAAEEQEALIDQLEARREQLLRRLGGPTEPTVKVIVYADFSCVYCYLAT